VSDNTSSEVSRAGKGRRTLLLVLIGFSFAVFVAGSFVFAYLFLFSASAEVYPDVMPKVGGVSLAGAPSKAEETSNPAAADPVIENSKRRINILLLGLDQRDDERGAPTRSDSMIIVSIDTEKKTVAMISLPRDMWVHIPGFQDNRINVANFLGDDVRYKYPGGGPALAKKTVEANFGIQMDYYARVNFRGFEKIVDTLGGITVNVENAIRDNEYPTEDYEIMSIYIPAGVQNMNGRVALQYARSRHSENDFGRAKRQQNVLVAMKDKALALDVIPKIPSLMGTMKDMIDTDIPPADIIRLATLAKDVTASSVSSLVIDEKLAPPFIGEGGANLLAPNAVEIRKAMAQLLADPIIKSEAARIELQNGTAKAGLTTKANDYLTDMGCNVLKVSSADRPDYKTTQIQVLSDKKATAAMIADALKVGQQSIVVVPRATPPAAATNTPQKTVSDTGPDIRVILGQDYVPPQ
jgi:polyisoprenyl-teichoic acid--peptidoglycan teichoic acid transferase